MPVKNKIFIGVTLFYIIYIAFPYIAVIFNIPTWLPSIFVSVVLISLFPKAIIRNKMFFWFVCYCLVTFAFFSSGRLIKIDIGACRTFSQLVIEYAFLLPNIIICSVLLNLNNIKVYKVIGYSVFAILFVSLVIIIPQLGQTDLRNLAEASEMDESVNVQYVLGFTLLHAYIIIFPAVYYYFAMSNDKANKSFGLILILLLVYIILKSSITTTIILLIVSFVLCRILISKNTESEIIIFIIVGVTIAILYYSGGFVMLLDLVSPFFEGTAVSAKIDDLKLYLMTGVKGESIDVRENLHNISWESFFSNPIYGGGRFGGHSLMLDKLGCMGVVGFVAYIMMYVSAYKLWRSKMNIREKRFYFIGFLSVIILLYSKGIFGQEGNLFFMVLLPIIILLPRYINEIEPYNKSSMQEIINKRK